MSDKEEIDWIVTQFKATGQHPLCQTPPGGSPLPSRFPTPNPEWIFESRVIGYSNSIVQQQFQMNANPVSGLVSGLIYGNNQISCGNIQTTEWIVTQS
ncbi:MAG: hypothetical protein ABSD75_16010 [Terriglobales bacterium]